MGNRKVDVDVLLKRTLNRSETPDAKLIRKVKYELIKEEPILKKTAARRTFSRVAAVAAALAIFTTTAFAAWHFLNASEVADIFNNSALSAAFESENAININTSVTSGDYIFTLLAIVSGKDIKEHPIYSNGEILSDRTYSVLAIQKTDGSPMPNTSDDEYGNMPFYTSPYVKGQKPWIVNAHTLNGGYSEMVVDGVMYRILECDEITMFADRGVYLGINTGTIGNHSQAFIYNDQTGELKANPNYNGSSAVFELPFDKALADSEKAERYLESLFNDPNDTVERNAGLDIGEDLWSSIDWDRAVPVTSTVKELTVDETGTITFTYDFEYGGGTIIVDFHEYFGDNQKPQSLIIHQIRSDDILYAICLSIDENGTITGMVVMPE